MTNRPGSIAFWTFGPNSTINDGSSAHFTTGPCNKKVTNFYNWPASSTHSKLRNIKSAPAGYSYGGNGKLITSYYTINDTFSFASTAWPALKNQEVALANYSSTAQLDANCKIPESDYDHSILGLAPFGVGGSYVESIGPSFRSNLLSQGQISSSSFSMWFDKAPNSAYGTFEGTAIFGAVPSKQKYQGDLVRLKLDPPAEAYVGYYVALPTLTATSFKKPGAKTTIKNADTTVKQCLLDSGTGQDMIPYSQSQLESVTGLIQYTKGGNDFTAWNGTCDSIPETAVLNYTFAGATAGRSVTVSVPIKNYARGQFDGLTGVTNKVCGLNLVPSNTGSCVFGAPFFTAVFLAFNDDLKQVAMAQGGVSTGSTAGPSDLGATTTIVKGQNVPGSV